MRKRRQFTRDFKAKVVLNLYTGVQSQAEACRKQGSVRTCWTCGKSSPRLQER